LPNQNSSLNNTDLLKTLILVPKGAEYQAITKNFPQNHQNHNWQISPTPIGCNAVGKYLQSLDHLQQYQQVIVMGLCGSLNPQLKVGDIVVYGSCMYQSQSLKCSPLSINTAKSPVKSLIKFTVQALTSDRPIYLAAEKQTLYKTTQADVVDMEGYVVLEFFKKLNIPVGMIRVVSDDAGYDLPNLDQAIDRDGNLKPLELAIAFTKNPIAAIRLIRGSLKSLQILSEVSLILNQKN
jgi:nucleoside phosphorylase